MSCYEWEEGTISLPAAGFAAVRKALQVAECERYEQAFEQTQKLWKSLTAAQKRNRAAYAAAKRDFLANLETRVFGSLIALTPQEQWLRNLTDDLLFKHDGTGWKSDGQPKRVQRQKVAFPTNRTLTFSNSAVTITFEKTDHTVLWSVDENNRAVDYAHKTMLAHDFWDAISTVRWTRNTGGVGVGNNEYNGDSGEVGAGGNYQTWAVGPLGEKASEFGFAPYVDSQGVHHRPKNRSTGVPVWRY